MHRLLLQIRPVVESIDSNMGQMMQTLPSKAEQLGLEWDTVQFFLTRIQEYSSASVQVIWLVSYVAVYYTI
jgi:hypothetical protein